MDKNRIISQMLDEEDEAYLKKFNMEDEAEKFFGLTKEDKEKRILDNYKFFRQYSVADLTRMCGLTSKKVCELSKKIKTMS
jgi:hypothetical protein